MMFINKELYDALLAANVPKELAAAAAKVDEGVKSDLYSVKVNVGVLKARLAIVEKLSFGIAVGVVGLLIKAYLLP